MVNGPDLHAAGEDLEEGGGDGGAGDSYYNYQLLCTI